MALATTEPAPDDPTLPGSPVPPPTPPGAKRWADLRLRILSAAVLAPLALGCVWFGGFAFIGLVALVAVGLSYEWLGLCGRLASRSAMLLFVAVPLAVVLVQLTTGVAALTLLAAAAVTGTFLFGGVSPTRPLIFGIPYLGIGAVALAWLRRQPESGMLDVIILLLVVWASDIGAYLVGRAVGGRRLAPKISPGKTWSGAVGGVLAAAAVGLAASVVLRNGLPSWRPVVFAAAIGIIGEVGDLFESYLKRRFGVKDSGSLIPGHGGLLDRLDALLTAAPAAALLALILGRGVVLWK